MHVNALFWKSQTHSVNDSIYDFDGVSLEIPVKNNIVGMLLTCPFGKKRSEVLIKQIYDLVMPYGVEDKLVGNSSCQWWV